MWGSGEIGARGEARRPIRRLLYFLGPRQRRREVDSFNDGSSEEQVFLREAWE